MTIKRDQIATVRINDGYPVEFEVVGLFRDINLAVEFCKTEKERGFRTVTYLTYTDMNDQIIHQIQNDRNWWADLREREQK
jgi:hypothetical protein